MASLGLKVVSGEYTPSEPQILGMTNYINVPFYDVESNHSVINRIGGLSYNRLRHLTKNDFLHDCVPNNLYDIDYDENTSVVKITEIGIYNPSTNTYIASSAYGIIFRKSDWSALNFGDIIPFSSLTDGLKGVYQQTPYSSINFSIEQAITSGVDFFYLKYEILDSSTGTSQYYHLLKFCCFGHRLKRGYHGIANTTFNVPHLPTVYPITYNDLLTYSNWTFYNESGLVVTDAIFDSDITFYPILNNVFPWIYPQINNYKGKYISKIYFLGFTFQTASFEMEELSALTYYGKPLKQNQSIPMYQLSTSGLLFNSDEFINSFGSISDLKIYIGIEDYLTGQIFTMEVLF